MMKRMRLYGVAMMLLVLLAGLQAGATGQIPEKIHYKGGTLSMSSKPLETFFTKDNPRPDSFEFYRLAQKDSVTPYRMAASSSACYRGYVGTWKVDEGALWLISLETVPKEQILLSAFNKDWISPVKATWYTGNLLVHSGQFFQTSREIQNFIIQVKEGTIVGEHEADRGHPLAILIEAESLTAGNITSAVISRTTADKPGEYKYIPREEWNDLLQIMAVGKQVPCSGDNGDGYYIMLKGGTFGNSTVTGGIRFNIYDDGRGVYSVDFVGDGFESKDLAELAKRIYASPKAVLAKRGKYGSFVAAPEEKKP